MGLQRETLKGKWSLPVGKAVDNYLSQQPSRIVFTTLRGLWDLSSLARVQSWALGSENTES